MAASRQSYSVTTDVFTPVANATDLFIIRGSATKLVKVVKLSILTTQTIAGINVFKLLMRTTANTNGAKTDLTPTPRDTNNATATALASFYTTNPSVLGTTVGNFQVDRIPAPTVASLLGGAIGQDYDFEGSGGEEQPIILRGVNQLLTVNLSGINLPAGLSVIINSTWTEE